MIGFSREEYEQRLNKLRARMKEAGIDLAFLNIPADIYYFCGTNVNSVLLVPAVDHAMLFVRLGYERALLDCSLEPEYIYNSIGMKDIKANITRIKAKAPTIGIARDCITFSYQERLQQLLSDASFVDISNIVLEIRKIKSPEEISIIRVASRIQEHSFQLCEKLIPAGITEIELQCELKKLQMMEGVEESMVNRIGISNVFGVVCSGPNTAVMSSPWVVMSGTGVSPARPWGASNRKIRKGDAIVVDSGIRYQGYHSDEARTFYLGTPSDELKKNWDILMEIFHAALGKLESGAPVSEVYFAAESKAKSHGMHGNFMGYDLCHSNYIGHGLGIEIDEPPIVGPNSKMILEKGMLLAIEPKLIIYGKYGLDIEFTVLVKEKGYELLCHYPEDLKCLG